MKKKRKEDLWEQMLHVTEVYVWKADGDDVTDIGEQSLQNVFYFLVADTAFLAASSRLSADVIGRPLSDRILLASWTLVPYRKNKNKT